jgi:hypothetical protein
MEQSKPEAEARPEPEAPKERWRPLHENVEEGLQSAEHSFLLRRREVLGGDGVVEPGLRSGDERSD